MLRRAISAGVFLVFALSGSVNAATLDAWWTFDGTTVDSSGNGNNLQLVSSPSYGSGELGQALDLNGTSQYARTTAVPGFSLMDSDFTISVWADFSSFDSSSKFQLPNTLVAEDDAGGPAQKWVFYYDYATNSLGFHVNNGGPNTFSEVSLGAAAPSLDTWNMFTVTGTGSSVSFYYDGIFLGSQGGITPSHPNSPITVGEAENVGFVHGALDDVRIYDGALSAGEVASLYSSDAPEPGTWAMALGGVLLVGMSLRRRASAR